MRIAFTVLLAVIIFLFTGCEDDSHTHSPGPAATCEEPQKCKECGKVLKPKIMHDYVWVISSFPNFESTNGEETGTCKNCLLINKRSITSTSGLAYTIVDGICSVSIGIAEASEIVIPIEYKGTNPTGIIITKIANDGFHAEITKTGRAITAVRFPDSLTVIDSKAFYGCAVLTDINIHDNITSIGSEAFFNCPKLYEIIIPDSVTFIGTSAFSGCTGLKSVIIGTGVNLIRDKTFSECRKLASIIIPGNVTSIGKSAFSGCISLVSVTINAGVSSINDNAFEGCTVLTSVIIPDSVTSIGNGVFLNCTALAGIVIPNSVTSIGYSAFNGCTALAGITISSNVTWIEDFTFSGCAALKEVTIPESVTNIGMNAFNGCTSLKSVTLLGDTPFKLGTGVFLDTSGDIEFFVPANSVALYKADENWIKWAEKIKAIVK